MTGTASDDVLAARVARGEVDALRALMARHGELLASVALSVTGARELAHEAVQDTFVQLWETRDRLVALDLSRGLAGYLVTMVRRRSLDLVRQEQRHARIVHDVGLATTTDGAPAVPNTGEQAIESRELSACIRAAIAALPARCREVFLLSRRPELSYDDIAAALGISNGTARNHVSHAMQQIAKAVAAWQAGD